MFLTKTNKEIALILTIGFIIRLLCFEAPILESDEIDYHLLAKSIKGTGLDTFRTPGYPLFLALTYLFNENTVVRKTRSKKEMETR